MQNIVLFLLNRLREREEEPVHSNKIFTVPNIITTVGLLGVGAYLWLLAEGTLWALPLIHLAVLLTDLLDGIAADLLKQHSKLGRALDPTRDRLHAGAVVLTIVIIGTDRFALDTAAMLAIAVTAESIVAFLGVSGRLGKAIFAGKVRALIYGVAGSLLLIELCWTGEIVGLFVYTIAMAMASVYAAFGYFVAHKPKSKKPSA